MATYNAQKFDIPELTGISAKNIEEHLKLYEGYVKHANLILEKLEELSKDAETNAYTIGELQRRFSFEFDGMRNHEFYFRSFEGGPAELSDGDLKKKIEADFGSYDAWLARFKQLAKTRGIGWAMLYYDAANDKLVHAWIDEQHLGHLTGLSPVLALDMWEHSYVADYQPSGKGKYIDDFFANLNWGVIEENFAAAKK